MSVALSCPLMSSGVLGMAGELSGVLDNDDATEPSLDDWLEIENMAQGGESTGTATVSGACGDLTVRTGGVENDVIIGFGNDVTKFSVGDIIVEGVEGVIFETVEITNDEVHDITVDEVSDDDATSGNVNADDVSSDEVTANDFDGVITNDVTTDEVTIVGVKDEDVNIVIGDDEMAVDDSQNIFSEEVIAEDVVVEQPDCICMDEMSDIDVIVDVSGIDDVTSGIEAFDGDTTTGVSVDGKGDVCAEHVFSFTKEKVEVDVSSASSTSVLRFESPVIVSLLLESLMLVLRFLFSVIVLSGSNFSVHKIF